MRLMYRVFVLAAFLPLVGASLSALAGCGLSTDKESLIEQQQRESITSKTTADVVTASKSRPANLTLTTTAANGTVLKVEQPTAGAERTEARTSAEEKSDSSAHGGISDTETIPFGTKLILAAVGLLMLGAALWFVIWLVRKSAAGRAVTESADRIAAAAMKAADDAIAKVIHDVRSKAMAASDPTEQAKLAIMAGDMERERVRTLQATPAAPSTGA